MRSTGTVTSKGQITIPVEVRQYLGLKQGDQLEFRAEAGAVMIRPARGEPNPFTAYIGALGPFPGGLEGIHRWIGDLREDGE